MTQCLRPGRNGCNDLLSPEMGVDGTHPYYGPGFVHSGGGNGRPEQQIVLAVLLG
jgi:hypothetical protein